LEEKLALTRRVLADLDVTHPTYATEFIENYNAERRKSGFPDYIPSEKEEEAYAATNPNKC
jgi:hypothetical protein